MDTKKTPDKLQLQLHLKSMQWLIIQRERELLLSEAKAHSFVVEATLLQAMPTSDRSDSYENDWVHT